MEGVNLKEYKYKEYIANVIPCIVYGIVCGFLTGLVIFLFKLSAKYAEEISRWLYSTAKGSPFYVGIVFVVLIAFAAAMVFLHKKIPEVKGGGIPRSEGILRGKLSFRWMKTLLGTFFGSMISFLCGLPLGSEGPAVLIGTSVGCMCGSVSKNKSVWNRYIMTGGAGAGFAVATGSPLSGVLFALEEIHKRFTPMLVITVSLSVLAATYVNGLLCSVFGVHPNLLEVGELSAFEFDHVGYLLLLGVITAAAVGVFDSSISLFGRLTQRIRKFLPDSAKLMVVFVITGVLGFLFADGIYSGHDVILEAIVNDRTVAFLAVLLLVRLIMMLLVTDCGATGGIFIPTLAIGALTAALIAKLLVFLGMPTELFSAVVLLGMCAFIGGTLRAPLTATVLFIEFTGQFTNLFFVALVIFVVNAITELLNQTSFYDRTLEKIEEAQNHGREAVIACFEMKVSQGAFVVGKTIRDVMWPASSVVIGITRAEEDHDDMDNDGEKKLYVGDTVVLRSRFYDEKELKTLLYGLVGTEYEIRQVKM